MIIRKVILKLLLITLLLGIITASLMLIMPSDNNHYMLALKDKHARLDSIASPKIILIGGSNIAFGINGKMIEDSLKMPVANMGIHVGLGLEYMINEVKPSIKKGDIVVMVPEYGLMFEKIAPKNNEPFFKALEGDFRIINYVDNRKKIPFILSSYVSILQSRLKSLLFDAEAEQQPHLKRNQKVYRRFSYNYRGDMMAHLGMSTQGFKKDDDALTDFKGRFIPKYFVHLTNTFNTYIKQHNAKLFMSFPPTPSSLYDKKIGENIFQDLSKKIDCPILMKPSEVVFPDSLFFDSRYHLLKESRSERTAHLIARLKAMN